MTRTEKTLAALNSWEKRPFTYGSADCCQFAAHVARALTGRDYMSAFQYANETEANALIDDRGGLESLVCSVLGAPSETLEDGDPVLLRLPMLGDLLGIRLHDYAVGLSSVRLLEIPERFIAKGWHVCRQ